VEELRSYFIAIDESYSASISELTEKARSVAQTVERYNLSVEQLPGKTRGFWSDLKKMIKGTSYKYGKTTAQTASGEKSWDKKVDESVRDNIVVELRELIAMIDGSEMFRNSCSVVLKNYRSFLLLNNISDEINEISRENGSLLLSRSMKILNTLTHDNDAPFIYEKIGTTFRTYMIDEFQDTSTMQWQNFTPLVNDAMAVSDSDNISVTLLGDVKQSIYGWRGGNWRLLGGDLINDISNRELIGQPMSLTTNWRSERVIIEFNNSLIRKFVAGVNETLNAALSDAREGGYITTKYYDDNIDIILHGYEDLEQTPSIKAKEDGGYVNVDMCDFDLDENLALMIEKIEDAQTRGYSAGEIAILIRTKDEAARVADYIINYKAENPQKAEHFCYDFVSAEALKLSSSKVVQLVINCMRASQKISLDSSVELVMFNSLRYQNYTSVISDEDREFLESLKHFSLLEVFEKIVRQYALERDVKSISYLQALHQKITTFASENTPEIAQFLEWWDSEASQSAIFMPQSSDSMFIATIHASKGLEFGVVLLPFVETRLTPLVNSLYWAESEIEPFDKIGCTLISYTDNVSRSAYARSYYDNLILSYIENTNILYVALTLIELYI
ncbi:MAG: UvrD-helicase domain-containing protein, partial [Rikenellaceae bacterium]